mmetsp:Transcript_2757/g.6460  ORF Transcript_2757/g.6460 Transcript_2757/m.6460 type:complete len:189 (+) Transcript_2757:119-685(+)|eukprot:CAMPEP_0113624802 /NCGR_PEP_ID=MMETSP0017_2-20120614/12797_1 /TAXON_ID=2856 /ORGANISM="Cylindrotheca closterium" /LENGTH=188 /DNA_ID=CAMNT_0000534867 /DNA_START=57 /DNA_END=623 /DNA_ORIENTATION=+ /assembly_acc=CAM_ASM_000147
MLVQLLPLSGIGLSLFGLATTALVAWKHGFDRQVGPARAFNDYIPVYLVSVGAMCLLYSFYLLQSYTTLTEFARMRKEYKKTDKKTDKRPSYVGIKYGTESKAVVAANRAAGNTLEQMLPFLVSLYGYATFVDAGGAARIGWAWIAFRSYYVIVFKRGFLVLSCTYPAYMCIWYMMAMSLKQIYFYME